MDQEAGPSTRSMHDDRPLPTTSPLRLPDRQFRTGETVVGPPAVTSHVECTEKKIAAAGIPPGMVRYSAGIEHVEDLRADLDQALAAL